MRNEDLIDLEAQHIEGYAKHGARPYSVPLYSKIVGNLWIGGCPVNEVPQSFQFVVCLYPWEKYKRHDHQTFVEAWLYDSNEIPEIRLLDALGDYVRSVSRIGRTLVHCQAGFNRSALVAGLALIKGGMKPADAIQLLRVRRCEAVLCNRTFHDFLLTVTR